MSHVREIGSIGDMSGDRFFCVFHGKLEDSARWCSTVEEGRRLSKGLNGRGGEEAVSWIQR